MWFEHSHILRGSSAVEREIHNLEASGSIPLPATNLNAMEEGYYYIKHGLLFIVYINIETGMSITTQEDSRWEDEEKAKEHCRILNSKQWE